MVLLDARKEEEKVKLQSCYLHNVNKVALHSVIRNSEVIEEKFTSIDYIWRRKFVVEIT